jgi:predicted DNA-binding protein
VGDYKERRQNGFLPDFRAAINAARRLREGNRVKRAAKEAKLNLANIL